MWIRPGLALDGMGRELVLAIEAHHPGRLETVVPVSDPGLCELLERLGFTVLAEVLEMAFELHPPLSKPRWPPGVRLRRFDAERDAADVHACLVEAFAGSDERVAPYEEWRPWLLGDPSYDPALVLVADVDGEVAGIARAGPRASSRTSPSGPRTAAAASARRCSGRSSPSSRSAVSPRCGSRSTLAIPPGRFASTGGWGWTSCATTPSTCAAKSSFFRMTR